MTAPPRIPHPRGLDPRHTHTTPEPVYVTVAPRLDVPVTIANGISDRPTIIIREGATLPDVAPLVLSAVGHSLTPGHVLYWCQHQKTNPFDPFDGSWPHHLPATTSIIHPNLLLPGLIHA